MRISRTALSAVAVVALVLGIGGTAAASSASTSIDKASSYRVIVNKQRPLSPKTYVPSDLVSVPVPHVYAPLLRKKASTAVVKMFKAFKTSTGKSMQSQSAYRSYTAQKSVYAGWVSSLGKKGADLTSARPGYSEHQTGLAIDISALPSKCALQACFASTTQGKWLKSHAWEYGFILRYPSGKTAVTGYEFEPWHYRYVGLALAKKMHVSGVKTLEEYFGTGSAKTY